MAIVAMGDLVKELGEKAYIIGEVIQGEGVKLDK